ncbi:unnamed protein product [Owenia fusiformis]|uniref:EXPERA domain-containing protein n=1 Tax=Owenia fusiformis TaxID=6347 RepID=A0A8S4Q9D0_OWEFU|nr:unnamed protein product [Owenia fusiformis]
MAIASCMTVMVYLADLLVIDAGRDGTEDQSGWFRLDWNVTYVTCIACALIVLVLVLTIRGWRFFVASQEPIDPGSAHTLQTNDIQQCGEPYPKMPKETNIITPHAEKKSAIDTLDEIMKSTLNNRKDITKDCRHDYTSLFAEGANPQTNDHRDQDPLNTKGKNRQRSQQVNINQERIRPTAVSDIANWGTEKHDDSESKDETNKAGPKGKVDTDGDLFWKSDLMHSCTSNGRIEELFALKRMLDNSERVVKNAIAFVDSVKTPHRYSLGRSPKFDMMKGRRGHLGNKPPALERQVSSSKCHEKIHERPSVQLKDDNGRSSKISQDIIRPTIVSDIANEANCKLKPVDLSLSAVVKDTEKHDEDKRKEQTNQADPKVKENNNDDLGQKADGIHPCPANSHIAELLALQRMLDDSEKVVQNAIAVVASVKTPHRLSLRRSPRVYTKKETRGLCANKPHDLGRQVLSSNVIEKIDEGSVLKHGDDKTPDVDIMVNDAVVPKIKTKQVSFKKPQDGGVAIMEIPGRESDKYSKEKKNTFRKSVKRAMAPMKPTKLINLCKTLKNRLKKGKSAKEQIAPACCVNDGVTELQRTLQVVQNVPTYGDMAEIDKVYKNDLRTIVALKSEIICIIQAIPAEECIQIIDNCADSMGQFEAIFLLYFGSHIPITIFIDAQAVFPQWIYPKIAVDLLEWYKVEIKDQMIALSPAWFQSFVICELTMQFPFFFVACYAFWKGNCPWIRIPSIVYGTHVATTLVPILAHIWWGDFVESKKYPAPLTYNEKMTLTGIYLPYILVPLLLLYVMLFTDRYTDKKQKRS